MFGKLLLIFIGLPLVEILILIKLGDRVGFWPTVFLVIVTGFIGAVAARIVGFHIWTSIQKELRNGRMPAEQMIDALIIFVAGIFLITPGLLSDITGLLLLIPGPRFLLKRWLRKKFDEMLRSPGSGSGSGFQYFIR